MPCSIVRSVDLSLVGEEMLKVLGANWRENGLIDVVCDALAFAFVQARSFVFVDATVDSSLFGAPHHHLLKFWGLLLAQQICSEHARH